jgi:hypothetical protein
VGREKHRHQRPDRLDVNGDGKSLVNVTKTDNITLTSGKNDMSWDATITPIAIDLNGDGIHTIAREDMTGSFDLLGTGKPSRPAGCPRATASWPSTAMATARSTASTNCSAASARVRLCQAGQLRQQR